MPIQEQLQQVLMSILQPFFMLFNPIILISAIIITIILVKKNKEYKSGSYYQITKLPYSSVKRDKGRYGEYLTYKYLKQFETNGAKFLFNIYIPKENGETTEIDVLMICSKGVFVFESKNYSGWIFGSESQKNWYQTLPKGRGRSHKEHFYNPIMQNRSHIKHLKAFLGEQVPMRSIIVFSDRCTLKSIQVKSNDISVINCCNVAPVVSAVCNQISTDLLSESDVTNLYKKLYPYTQVDTIAKAQHIANIHKNLNPQPVQQIIPPVGITHTGSIEKPVSEPTKTEDTPPLQTESNETTSGTTETQPPNTSESEANESASDESQVLKCPKCNGNLVLRTASRGTNAGKQFYGCSNYPKCKFIQSLE